MQKLIMALEVNFCAICYLQDKQKLQAEGATLNTNVNKKDFE